MKYSPRKYQQFAEQHILDNPGVGLFMDMGLGKTVITLTALDRLIFDRCETDRALVIAPLKVAQDVWSSEIEKWDHLQHLRVSLVLGTERKRVEALKATADIYVINRENVPWLVSYYGLGFPFDTVIVDELSSFKSHDSQRFKSLRMIRPKIRRIVGLTGTPAPNGLADLWSQVYLLDQGERLGKRIGEYREKYFTPGRRNGYVVYDYSLRKPDDEFTGDDYYERKIYDKIGDICISMKKEDYLDLPARIDTTAYVTLPDPVMAKYQDFEREQVLKLAGQEITALNAAALTGKLLQFASGAVYDENKAPQEVHGEKLEALAEDVEALQGRTVLIFYWFKSDLPRIKTALKKFKPVEMKGPETIRDWNAGKIPVLLAHPASAGHGLNLQDGGHNLFWYGCPWSLELYQQGIGRLERSGQKYPVLNKRFVVRGTIDEDVIAALENKTSQQEALLSAVKARIDKYAPALTKF